MSKYCYLVYCNVQPIVYAVCSAKKSAIKYADSLVDYRRKRALEQGFKFGFYHEICESIHKESEFDKIEKLIYSKCLMIKDKQDNPIEYENGCFIKVERRRISH